MLHARILVARLCRGPGVGPPCHVDRGDADRQGLDREDRRHRWQELVGSKLVREGRRWPPSERVAPPVPKLSVVVRSEIHPAVRRSCWQRGH